MKTKILLGLVVLTAFFALSCKQEEEEDKLMPFELKADGGETKTTSKLILLFQKEVTKDAVLCTAADFTLDPGDTGAVKGEYKRNALDDGIGLPRDTVAYNLELKEISSSGKISILFEKKGYYVRGGPRIIQVYYYFNANIPTELADAWYMGNATTPQYTFKSDGTLLVNGIDNNLQASVSDDGTTITTYNNKKEAGTAKFSISDNTLTISEATSGSILVNGTYTKKTS